MAQEVLTVAAPPGLRDVAQSTDSDRSWYSVAGPALGRPIVLVHGVELTRHIWTPQVPRLARDFRVVTPDLPGHGALAHTPFAFDAAIERLVRLIDDECGGRACVAGLSLGGYITMRLACLYPDRLSGLVLSGCCSQPRGVLTLPHRTYAQLVRYCNHNVLNLIHSAILRRIVPREYAGPIINGGIYKATMPQAVKEMMGRDFGSELCGYEGPVLFLNGRWDFLFRRDEAAFVDAAPNSRLCVVPRAGHPTNLQNPEAFNEALCDFAASLDW